MTTSTTSRGGRILGTGNLPYDTSSATIQAHRMSGGASGARDRVMLHGRYVLNASGSAELVVSVNQKAFKQKMAVRDINGRVDGRTPSESTTTAVTIGSV